MGQRDGQIGLVFKRSPQSVVQRGEPGGGKLVRV
jgi:hypothetical protein